MHLLQLQQLQPEFRKVNALVLAISVEPNEIGEKFSKERGIDYPLFSDPHHTVIDAYKTYSPPDKFSVPALFLVDRQGVIRLGSVGVPHGPFDPSAMTKSIELLKKAGVG